MAITLRAVLKILLEIKFNRKVCKEKNTQSLQSIEFTELCVSLRNPLLTLRLNRVLFLELPLNIRP